MSRTRYPGLYCGQLDWFLRCSAAELGQRGTTAAVVLAVERGGASGGGEEADLAMLMRCYELPLELGKRPRPNVVARHRRLSARWALVPPGPQKVLLAHYLATERADSKIRARFGKLAGVVLLQWLELNAALREIERKDVQARAHEESEGTRRQALGLERRLARARAACQARDPFEAFRAQAQAHYLRTLANEAWRSLGLQRRRESTLLEHGSVEADARALALACTRGDPPPLEADAESACRAAHAAWYDTRQQLAQRWADGEEAADSPS